MRRIILFFTLVLMAGTIFAQTSTQINFQTLKKRLEKSNADIENPKRNAKFQTWQSRGDLMIEIYEAMTLNAAAGWGPSEFNVIVGQPKVTREEKIEEQLYTVFEMDRVNFYFFNNVLEFWTFTNELYENPLIEAKRSLLEANKMDVKGRSTKTIGESLKKLKYHLITEGSNSYAKKDYLSSRDYFSTSTQIGENPLVNYVDTAVIYYTGLSAQIGKDYESAINYYKKSLEFNYFADGNTFFNIYEAYKSLEKEEDGLTYLEQGFLKFPKNESILYSLINYYITKGEDPNVVLEYIGKAMENQPNDFSLYFAEGFLYDKLENIQLAEKSYLRSIEINPDFFDALFNLGAIYFNEGVKFLEEANKVPAREFERYDALILKSNEQFRKSIPYMERAYQADTNSKSAIESLRNLYFRFRSDGAEMQKKYDEINTIFNELGE